MKDHLSQLDIKVSPDQKIWLECLYNKMEAKEQVNYRILRSELYHKIAKDFNPDSIDDRLVNYRGTELTLLGLAYLDPEKKILQKTDQVIKAIKELLLENSALEEAEIDQLSSKTKINLPELDLILFLITRIREPNFSNGFSGNSEYRCRSIRISDESTFDNFLNYQSLDEVLEAQIRGRKEGKLQLPKSKSRKRFIQGKKFGNPYLENGSDGLEGITCQPIFKSPVPNVDQNLCFVLMPFKMEWSDEVYKELIRPNVERLGLQCLRADILTGINIIEDVWTKINQCAFIIADVTSTNPNVMYEMGIVHTVGKPTILLTQDIKNIPFDVLHLRHHPYQNSLTGAKEFKSMLERQIRAIYEENYPDVQLKKD